jgi:hypothetical protein
VGRGRGGCRKQATGNGKEGFGKGKGEAGGFLTLKMFISRRESFKVA